MKKNILLFLLLALFFNSKAGDSTITAYVDHCIFYSPQHGSYVELYFSIQGSSIRYIKNKNNKLQAAIKVTYLIKQNDSIKAFDKYILNSPELEDSSQAVFNLIDRKSAVLLPGVYLLEVTFADFNDPDNKFKTTQTVNVNFDPEKISISDIQLVERYNKTEQQNNFSKSGYDLVPYVYNFYPKHISQLTFYCEVYNTKKVLGEAPFLISYSVRRTNTDEIIGSLGGFIKETPDEVNVLLTNLDIKLLPSGNYDLVVEVRDKQNRVKAKKILFFQRSNPMAADNNDAVLLDIDDMFIDTFGVEALQYYLRSLKPIASNADHKLIDNVVERGDLQVMRQYFLNFWKEKSKSEAVESWFNYKEKVDMVEKAYGTMIYDGFETDRGFVYLHYDMPNNIDEGIREGSAPPYEIWQYYSMENQSDIIFVFANFELVGNNYRLVHSNARGELYNPNWKSKIKRGNDDYGINMSDFYDK